MLSPERIRRAEYNVKGYLRNGLIKKTRKFDYIIKLKVKRV